MAVVVEDLRVLVADDHALYRRGLVMELEKSGDLEVVAEAASGEEAVERAISLAPDVILMDVRMPGIGGVEATRRIVAATPSARVLMLSVSDDAGDLIDAVRAGAAGYLLKEISIAEVGASARRVARGHSFLSPGLAGRLLDEFAVMSCFVGDGPGREAPSALLTSREVAVMRMLADGVDDAAIAAATGMTVHAVRNHVRNVLEKLQLASRAEAVFYAVRTRLVDP